MEHKTDTDNERTAFQAWCAAQGRSTERAVGDPEQYASVYVQNDWEVWQARASLTANAVAAITSETGNTATTQGAAITSESGAANAGSEPVALNPRHIRKFLQALQAGEMSVGRAVEILDAWVGGYYSDDMVPPPPSDTCLIADDEFPMEIVRKLRREMSTHPSPPEGMAGWQPIATAPKDVSVLLFSGGMVAPVYCGRQRYGTLGEPQQHEFAWRCDSSGRFATPRLWMHIPPLPASEAKGAT